MLYLALVFSSCFIFLGWILHSIRDLGVSHIWKGGKDIMCDGKQGGFVQPFFPFFPFCFFLDGDGGGRRDLSFCS